MSRPLRGRPAFWLAVGLLVGCGPAPQEPVPVAGAETPALRMIFGGCDGVMGYGSDPLICALREKPSIRLWVSPPEGSDIRITLNDRPLDTPASSSEDGLLFRLQGLEPGLLRFLAILEDQTIAEGVLRLADLGLPEEIVYARKAYRADPEGVRELVQGLISKPPAPKTEAGALKSAAAVAHAYKILAGIELDAGHGDLAESYFREAYTRFEAIGDVRHQIEIGTLLSRIQRQDRGNSAAAWEELQRLPPATPADGASTYFESYYRGNWALRTGALRLASQDFERALGIAERLQVKSYEHAVLQLQASLLGALGRHAEAVELLRGMVDENEPTRPCEGGQWVHNLAWAQLSAWTAWGGPEAAGRAGQTDIASFEPIPLLNQALEGFSDPSCDVDERINTHFDLALAHLHLAETDQARQALRGVSAQGGDPKAWHLVWGHDLEGRIALEEGAAEEALDHFDRLAELAERVQTPDASWRASVGRARALRAMGQNRAALRAYAAAEALMDQELSAIPVERRETSLQARAVGITEQVNLLIELGRLEDAFAAARRARARTYRGLAESARVERLSSQNRLEWMRILDALAAVGESESRDWAQTSEQKRERVRDRRAERARLLDRAHLLLGGDRDPDLKLPDFDPNEAFLLYRESPDGWVAFAAFENSLTVRRLPRPDRPPSTDDAWSDLLLAPFKNVLSEARRIRIVPGGSLSNLDFHALPFDGGALLDRGVVVYGMDLPRIPSHRQESAAADALLVVDPNRNLLWAAAEGDLVERALRKQGSGSLIRLDYKQASLATVAERLPEVDFLHFAGHGDFSGTNGWDSGLSLADESRLTVPHLLTLVAVPGTVVLSACESAATADGWAEGLGLARAFLLAGSREVVGAARPASDEASKAFSELLYRHWDGASSVAGAARRAQLELRERGLEWKSFRVVAR